MATTDIFSSFVGESFSVDPVIIRSVFKAFDQDSDNCLNSEEFANFLSELFRSRSNRYELTRQQIEDFRYLVDLNSDGAVDYNEFQLLWEHVLHHILKPVSALIVLDAQNDLICGSAAAINPFLNAGADSTLNTINWLSETSNFDHVFYTQNWFPKDHVSFITNLDQQTEIIADPNPSKIGELRIGDRVTLCRRDILGQPLVQKLYPPYCVAESYGAQLHPCLKLAPGCRMVHKGVDPTVDARSAFWDSGKLFDTGLIDELKKRKVTDVYIAGFTAGSALSTTVEDACLHGYRTILIRDACHTCVDPGDLSRAIVFARNMGAVVAQTSQVRDMVRGSDRRPESGFVSVVNYALALKRASDKFNPRPPERDQHEPLSVNCVQFEQVSDSET